MPTGYTYPIVEGKVTTLRQFALLCARGMGATIMMRDEPMDAPIPERFEPSTSYHDERLPAARALLAELPTLSEEECERRASAEYESDLAGWQKYEDESIETNRRLRAMLAEVEGWETKASGIKEFMLEQLRISIDFDSYSAPKPVKKTAAAWRSDALHKAARDVGYHEAERAKEIARTEDRNCWLADLRTSLPDEGAQ